jgi:hypothetical protein
LKSSGISSATKPSSPVSANPSAGPSASAPTRRSFALAGRSAPLDPLTNAVRSDLADIRLADRVFAPHYAAPMVRRLGTGATLRGALGGDSVAVAELAAGELFEVLELTHDCAWGVAPAHGLVGYLPAGALA